MSLALKTDISPQFCRKVFYTVLLLLCTLTVGAQAPDLSQKISVQYSGIQLETVLKDISRLAGIHFSYSPASLPVNLKINYAAQNKPLEQVLNDIFQQAGIQFGIVNEYLILKTKSEEIVEPKPVKPELFTISGTIADSSNNEVLIGAAVYVRESGVGTVSNNYGFFSLTLRKGIYTFETAYLGYTNESKSVDLKGNETWNINLKAVPSIVKEIIVSSVTNEDRVFNSLAAQRNVESKEVQQHVAAMGETDMLKSLDNLPGISFQSDGSSYFYVRGGNRDQNLILLDEAPIFNPSHLLGLFTPIIPEAVKHTEIYKADFPIQYGGRLSSVTDIRTRDGNLQRFSGSASLGPVSTRLSLEGPFKKNASSYFVSVRRSTFGYFVKKLNPSVEKFHFTDFTAKFNIKAGRRDRLFITLFSGQDIFINKPNAKRNGLEWGNTSLTLRWNHIYGSRLFSNTTISGSRYNYALYTDYDKKISWNSDITSSTLKSEYTWFLNPRNKVKFGLGLGGYFFNPGNYNASETPDNARVSEVNSGELVLYAGNEQEITDWLQVNYGFRLSNWSNYGEAFSVLYDENYNPLSYEEYPKGKRYYSKNFLEPRISLSVRTGRLASLKASYNRTTQHINLINNSISPFNTLEVWLPSGPNIKPQYADIFDLGFVKAWPAVLIDISADVYYKKMYNQVGYDYHAEMLLNPLLEGELRQGDGYACGFEILLKKALGKFSGQLGYAYTRSFLKIQGLNNNRWYPSHQDKPVDFSFLADYRIKPRWTVNLNVVYTSGMTLSTPTGFYYYRGVQVPVYTKQNNDRLPDYKRVDIGSIWRLNKPEKTFEHYLNFSLYNVFSIKNYAFLNFNKTPGEEGKFYVPADNLNMAEQVVTYRYIYSIIPSLTYSLKF
jgi:hypothetical protein